MNERLFWSRIKKTPTCWTWTGKVHVRGYGAYNSQRAHRVAWKLLRGPLTSEQILHHVCGNKLCCNPDHLRVMSQGEHIALHKPAAGLWNKTHCKNGHEQTPENRKKSGNRYHCRLCANANQRRFYARKKRNLE